MRAAFAMIVALAAATIAQPLAAARAIEEKNVVAGKARLDPAMGYVFASPGTRMFATFLRVPEEADRTAWQADWEKAFAKATEKYRRDLKSWEAEAKSARELKTKVRARPIEPTDANFAIDPLETRDMAFFGPLYAYSKANDTISYLTEMKPGTYLYYGPILFQPGAATVGQCYCMGSVRFEVKPGAITDIGNFLNALPADPPFDYATFELRREAAEKAAKGGAKPKIPSPPPPVAFGHLPASLAGWSVAPADFRANGKVNNYFLLPITRIPAIPGIIAYKRDTAIDLKTGTEVPNPPIKTVLRIKR